MKLRQALPLGLGVIFCAYLLYTAAEWLARATMGLFAG